MQLDLDQLKGGLPDIKSFASTLSRLGADKRYALAVSGGPDSLAMLVLFAQWRAKMGWTHSTAGGRDVVLSIDHSLREAAANECAAVAKVAASLGFAHQTLIWQHQGIEAGLQHKARAARYKLLDEAASKALANFMLLAHTRDDQAETVLMRLVRGAGPDGLSAISAHIKRGDLTTPIVRPLLDVPKSQLLAFLNANGIAYASDPSNEDMTYERVRLRKFLNVMELNEPHIKGRLAASALRMGRAVEALEHYTTDFLQTHTTQTMAGSLRLPLMAYKGLPREIRLRVIKRIIACFGHGDMPQDASLEVIEMVIGGAGNAATLGGWQFRTTSEFLSIEREIGRFAPVAVEAPQTAQLWDKRFTIKALAQNTVLEAVGDRWPEVKALYKLQSTNGLSDLERAALPCFTSAGQIVQVPFFETEAQSHYQVQLLCALGVTKN